MGQRVIKRKKQKHLKQKAKELNTTTINVSELAEALTNLRNAIAMEIKGLQVGALDLDKIKDASVDLLKQKFEGSYQLIVEFNNKKLTPLIDRFNKQFGSSGKSEYDLTDPEVMEYIMLFQQVADEAMQLNETISTTTIAPYKALKKEIEANKENIIEGEIDGE